MANANDNARNYVNRSVAATPFEDGATVVSVDPAIAAARLQAAQRSQRRAAKRYDKSSGFGRKATRRTFGSIR